VLDDDESAGGGTREREQHDDRESAHAALHGVRATLDRRKSTVKAHERENRHERAYGRVPTVRSARHLPDLAGFRAAARPCAA
jgi:hypothetical protein